MIQQSAFLQETIYSLMDRYSTVNEQDRTRHLSTKIAEIRYQRVVGIQLNTGF